MRYFYLSRNEMMNGNVLVYDTFNIEVPLEAYRSGAGKEDAIQYIGENIPNDIEYDAENDVLYSAGDRPSPYHVFVKGTWIIKDKAGYRQFCNEKIEEKKKQILEYGFDYQGHRQRCRDKDVAFMVASVTALDIANRVLNIKKTVTWYFEDNAGIKMSLEDIARLMLYGTTFIQSVFDAENYFKTLEEPVIVTRETFETKRHEIHERLANDND